MKPETAQIVRRMMETVVKQGSGSKAAIDGVDVGGKTGTAQLGGDLPPMHGLLVLLKRQTGPLSWW